jgi:hypothetical protein
MDENIKNICLFGQYYNPAEKHYGKECDVICDKCFRHDLDVAIGWETYDLCLKCAQSVNKSLNKHIEPVVKDKDLIQTKMCQAIFKPKKSNILDFQPDPPTPEAPRKSLPPGTKYWDPKELPRNEVKRMMMQRQFIKKSAVAKK